MQRSKFKLILASQSPRRKELMQWLFVPFEIIVSHIEEKSNKQKVEDLVQDLAYQKAQHVYDKIKEQYGSAVVVGADTIVVLENEVLGKPQSREEAKVMLQKLMGKTHRVLTGVSIIFSEKEETFFDETLVYFDKISDDLLELYLDTGESMDKAGAYGIQGAALGFIGKIEGSYSNVVGLPINLLLDKLKTLLELKENNWRRLFEV